MRVCDDSCESRRSLRLMWPLVARAILERIPLISGAEENPDLLGRCRLMRCRSGEDGCYLCSSGGTPHNAGLGWPRGWLLAAPTFPPRTHPDPCERSAHLPGQGVAKQRSQLGGDAWARRPPDGPKDCRLPAALPPGRSPQMPRVPDARISRPPPGSPGRFICAW
jgi:hypothetical protein